MKRYNILLAGVGGQGLLTLGSIIGNAAIEEGIDVIIAETHGLSQRGGSLVVHVRLGEDSLSPITPRGAVDLLIGLEAIETYRYLHYAGKETIVVMNKFLWPPPLAKTPSLEDIVDAITKTGVKLYVVDAIGEAKKSTGLAITANSLILGYAYAVDKRFQEIINIDSLKKSLEHVFSGKTLELNKKALLRGIELGKTIIL